MTKEELYAIADHKYDFTFSQLVDEGYKIFKKNIGGFIGIIIVNFCISWALSLIPFVGSLLSYFTSAFISAGMIVVSKKLRNDEETQFGDFFEVFKNPGPFTLLLIVQFGMMIVVALPAIAIFFSLYYETLFASGTPSPSAIMAIVPIMFLALIPVFFLSMCYIFSFHIFLFLNQDFWVALETSRKLVMKNFLSIFGLLFLAGLFFILVTLITCGLAYFVVLPTFTAGLYVAFERIFKPSFNSFENKIDSFGSQQPDINTEADERKN